MPREIMNPRQISVGDIPHKMRAVYELAAKSNDTSTKNGAILCRERWNVSHGYNHVPAQLLDIKGVFERPLKYDCTTHAERDVIFDAVSKHIDVRGTTMVANWVACPDCALAIAMCGVADVVCHKECMDRTPERWKEKVDLGLEILERFGVRVHYWSGKIGDIENLNNGEIWYP